MSFLVDTNVLSELRKRERGHPNVFTWTETTGWHALHTSWIAIAEMKRGAPQRARFANCGVALLDPWNEAPE